MKTTKFLAGILVLVAGVSACTQEKEGRFLNLSTGEEVYLVQDKSGQLVDSSTKQPVLLYADTRAKDTFYGPTGTKVNGHLQRLEDGVYVYDDGDRKIKIDADSYKMKDGDVKIKQDGEGSFKYKDDEMKIKSDGDFKIKKDGYTKKVDEDGDVKIETKDKKIKVDGETGEKKVKDRSVFGKVKDKVIGN